ncbi:MAG: hypothetical protein WHU10_08880, partial [Fimbriimonadales bacterium]
MDKERSPEERELLQRCRSLALEEAEAELARLGVAVDAPAVLRSLRDAAARYREPLRLYVESLSDEELDRELLELGIDPAGAQRSFESVQSLLRQTEAPLRLYVDSLSDEELDRELRALGVDPAGAERSFAAIQQVLSEMEQAAADHARNLEPQQARAELARHGLDPRTVERMVERLLGAFEVAHAEAEAAAVAAALGLEPEPEKETEFTHLGRRMVDLLARLQSLSPLPEEFVDVRNFGQDLAAELLRPKVNLRRIARLTDRWERLYYIARQALHAPSALSRGLDLWLEDFGRAAWRAESLALSSRHQPSFQGVFALQFRNLDQDADEDEREEDLAEMDDD